MRYFKADRLTPLLIKSNIVALTNFEEKKPRKNEGEVELLKILRDKIQNSRHIALSQISSESLRRAFSSLSYEDFTLEYDTSLMSQITHREAIQYQGIPGRLEKNCLLLLTTEPENVESLDFFKERFGVVSVQPMIISDQELFDIVHRFYQKKILEEARFSLVEKRRDLSACYVFSRAQWTWVAAALGVSLAWFYFLPYSFLISLFLCLQFIYLITIGFRFFLTIGGMKEEVGYRISNREIKSLPRNLPYYSILVPLYKEPQVVKNLLRSLKNLDYPSSKLEVLLLLEQDDHETLVEIEKLDIPSTWRSVLLPDCIPKTKPKACNYGLQLARGEYVTIYDAEDLPDRDQLKKAIVAMNKMGDQALCVQAALNYYNMNENFITGMFTLEYSYWFDYLLPGLVHYQMPIPLGGTSNHFKAANLRKIGGWDPFNTTEDADAGVRAYANNMTVGTIHSTTYEEANSRYGNWIRQRSRWIKGYMQTSLVYNRHPWKLMKTLGFKNWLAFQFLITGTPLMFLINPLVWAFFLLWLWKPETWSLIDYPIILNVIGGLNLVIGNFLGIYFNMLGVFHRRLFSLLPFTLLNPIYWLCFHSVAAYKALWQLFTSPFYWEKTTHGLTQFKTPDV